MTTQRALLRPSHDTCCSYLQLFGSICLVQGIKCLASRRKSFLNLALSRVTPIGEHCFSAFCTFAQEIIERFSQVPKHYLHDLVGRRQPSRIIYALKRRCTRVKFRISTIRHYQTMARHLIRKTINENRTSSEYSFCVNGLWVSFWIYAKGILNVSLIRRIGEQHGMNVGKSGPAQKLQREARPEAKQRRVQSLLLCPSNVYVGLPVESFSGPVQLHPHEVSAASDATAILMNLRDGAGTASYR